MMLSDLRLKKRLTMREQITSQVRDLIRSGQLSPGSKLPSTQELARQWNTQGANVHAALQPLVREGLLARKPGVGTLVQDPNQKLKRIGVYYSQGNIQNSRFIQALRGELNSQALAAGYELRHLIDFRDSQDSAPPELAELADKREIQALIVATTDLKHLSWQRKLPIPMAFNSSAKIREKVTFDHVGMIDLALGALQQAGCQSVGLLCSVEARGETPDHPNLQLHKYFRQRADELNMEFREEWCRWQSSDDGHKSPSYERLGYELFDGLWRLPARPQGIFVYTDDIVTGVLMAILKHGVQVPEELKLALHHNAELDLLCPLPAWFVETSVADVARGLIHLVEQQFHGENIDPCLIPFTLQQNKSTAL
jgi:DNA-binding LacI/PurR family transcriptional regulator